MSFPPEGCPLNYHSQNQANSVRANTRDKSSLPHKHYAVLIEPIWGRGCALVLVRLLISIMTSKEKILVSKKVRPSPDAILLMCRTKYIFAPRS